MTRRMPAPWEVEEIPGGYCVVDAEGKRLAYVYGLDPKELAAAGHERLTKDEARRVASNIAKLPELLGERQEEYQMNAERKDAEESVKKLLDAVPAGGTCEHDLEALTVLFGGAARARLQTLANECDCTAEFDDKANKIIFKKGKG